MGSLKLNTFVIGGDQVIGIIAQQLYVSTRYNLGRGDIFYLFSSFFMMHHSIELYIKAILEKNNIVYPWTHKLTTLLKLLELCSKTTHIYKYIFGNKNIMQLLQELEKSYGSIKYGKSYIETKTDLIDYYDALIFNLHIGLYGENRRISIPEELLNDVAYNNNQEFIWELSPRMRNHP